METLHLFKPREFSLNVINLIVFIFSISVVAVAEMYTADVYVDNFVKYTCRGNFTEDGQFATKTNTFYTQDGKALITEDVTFQLKTFQPVDISITNRQTGRLEKVTRTKEGYRLQYRENNQSEIKEKTVRQDGIVLHGSYVPIFIAENMDKIRNGAIIRFQLLVVDRLTSYEFQVYRHGLKNLNGQQYIEVSLEPTSWFVKQFVAPIFFEYALSNNTQIARYRGTIAPRTADGKAQTGEIIFHFPVQ